MKKIILLSILLVLLSSCIYNDENINLDLTNTFELEVKDNNQLADSISEIRLVAMFSKEYSNEAKEVKFIIKKSNTTEEITKTIQIVNIDGYISQYAEIFITSQEAAPIIVTASLTINGHQVIKEIEMMFVEAKAETIHNTASSLIIQPDISFTEITLTAQLNREIGVVSLETKSESKVVDLDGNPRGLFVDYKNLSDVNGQIKNQFTMGNDPYEGELYYISETVKNDATVIKDTLTIYSQN